jgi:HlyD family secretion protein
MLRPVLVAALIAALALPVQAAGTAEPEAAEAVQPPAITVLTVGTRLLRDRVIASGLVAAVDRVDVAPLIEGQPIEALLADVGDTVVAGQVLARLSEATLELQRTQGEAQLAAARASVAQAEASVLEARTSAAEARRQAVRARTLADQGVGPKATADQAEANATAAAARVGVAEQALAAAQAQVALSEASLASLVLQWTRTEVKAPVGGTVVARNARIGSIASAAAAPMFTIVRDGALEVLADLAEADLVRVAPGQPAGLRAVGQAAPFAGRVRLVEPSIDTTTRLGRVRVAVETGAPVVMGMFVEAEIVAAEREAIAVPVTAIGANEGQATVMKVTDGRVARVPVQTGIRDGGWIEIAAGLAAGDTVVAKAGAFVRDGDRITPVTAPVN